MQQSLARKSSTFWKVSVWDTTRSWLAKLMTRPLWHNEHRPGSQPLKRCIPERVRTGFFCGTQTLMIWGMSARLQQGLRPETSMPQPPRTVRTRTLHWRIESCRFQLCRLCLIAVAIPVTTASVSGGSLRQSWWKPTWDPPWMMAD